jgi:hypothetical protein
MSDIPYPDTPQPDIPVPPLPDIPTPVPEVEPDPGEGPDLPPEPSEPPGDDVPKVGLRNLIPARVSGRRGVVKRSLQDCLYRWATVTRGDHSGRKRGSAIIPPMMAKEARTSPIRAQRAIRSLWVMEPSQSSHMTDNVRGIAPVANGGVDVRRTAVNPSLGQRVQGVMERIETVRSPILRFSIRSRSPV